MMERSTRAALLFAMVTAAGCGGDPPEAERSGRLATADTATVAAASDSHAGHAIGGSAAESTEGLGQASASAAAGGAHTDHAGTAADGAPAGAHATGAEGTAGPAVAHGAHAVPEASPVGAVAAAHAAHAVSGAREAGAAAAVHAGHPMTAAAGGALAAQSAGGGAVPTDGVNHGAHATAAAVAGAPGVDHSERGMAAPGTPAARERVSLPDTGPDAGMEKLLALVAGLVRDTLVQREIENDPALRTLWEDPRVRRVVIGHSD